MLISPLPCLLFYLSPTHLHYLSLVSLLSSSFFSFTLLPPSPSVFFFLTSYLLFLFPPSLFSSFHVSHKPPAYLAILEHSACVAMAHYTVYRIQYTGTFRLSRPGSRMNLSSSSKWIVWHSLIIFRHFMRVMAKITVQLLLII